MQSEDKADTGDKTMTQPEIDTVVAEIERLDKQGKAIYAQKDRLELELIEELLANHSGHATLSDGRPVDAVNNFIDPKTGKPRNKAFRPAGVKLWELVIGR
jgi:hypothetical protein